MLIGDDKSSRHNRENLQQPTQIQLSEKPKGFRQYFIAF